MTSADARGASFYVEGAGLLRPAASAPSGPAAASRCRSVAEATVEPSGSNPAPAKLPGYWPASSVLPTLCFLSKLGGGGWIRTSEACASDLQSDPFGHSGTPPKKGPTFSFWAYWLSTSFHVLSRPGTAWFQGSGGKPEDNHPAQPENGAGERNRTPDRLITNQLLYLLSYASLQRTRIVMNADSPGN
jgi:hypothetical protein